MLYNQEYDQEIINIDHAEDVILMDLPQKIITLGKDFEIYNNGWKIRVSDLTSSEKIKLKEEAARYGKKLYFQCDYADYIWQDILKGKFY